MEYGENTLNSEKIKKPQKPDKSQNNTDNSNMSYISVAKIMSPHGINGYMSLKSFTSPDLNIFSYKKLFDKNGNDISVEKIGVKKDCFIVCVNQIDDRNDAEKLKGNLIYINQEDLPEIENDKEFYYIDLVGIDVIKSSTDKKVGEVISVEDYGAGELLEIQFLNGTKELYIFSNENFPKVDIENNHIIANFPETITAQDNKKKK